MARLTDQSDIVAYRDAIGTVLATRRADEDAVEWLQTFQPSLKTRTSAALVAMLVAMMREYDRVGGDSNALLERWAMNLADYEPKS